MAGAKTLLLIDGNNLFHRAYHALPPLTDKSGENANAVFGFSNMILKAISEVNPDYIACAFDTQAPTFRHVEFEAYKAQRVAPPPDLYPQLPKVKAVLDAFGIKYFEKEGFEADDLLATIATKVLAFSLGNSRGRDQRSVVSLHKARRNQNSEIAPLRATSLGKSVQIVILSGDRDLLQLVDGNIKVQAPSFAKASDGKPGWGVLMGSKEVREKFGLTPEQMVDYKSLTGDPSDNVPGVSGIGPKTASQLLQRYHTLENLYGHLDEISETTREKLEKGRELALAAKKLVKLDTNVDLGVEINNLKYEPDMEKVVAQFGELGFKSIVSKIRGTKGKDGPSSFAKASEDKKEPEVEKTTRNSGQLELI